MTAMLKMRLQQNGRKNDPHCRIVVMNAHQGPKSGKYVDILGSYNMKMGTIILDKDKATHWISVGAQPSVTVHNMLVREGVIDAPKKNALPKKTAPVKEVVAEEPKEEAPATKETASEETPAEEVAPEAEALVAEEAPVAEEEAPKEAPAEEEPAA